MKVTLVSIITGQDQEPALAFYRDILGFVVKEDVPTGPPGAPRWRSPGLPRWTTR